MLPPWLLVNAPSRSSEAAVFTLTTPDLLQADAVITNNGEINVPKQEIELRLSKIWTTNEASFSRSSAMGDKNLSRRTCFDQKYIHKTRAVVVAQLAEWSLPKPEVQS